MLAIQLPSTLEERLTAMAQASGRRLDECVIQAVTEYLDHFQDLEDYRLAQERLDDVRTGRSRTYSLDDVERELGLAD